MKAKGEIHTGRRLWQCWSEQMQLTNTITPVVSSLFFFYLPVVETHTLPNHRYQKIQNILSLPPPANQQQARIRLTETYIQFGHSKNVDSLERSNQTENHLDFIEPG